MFDTQEQLMETIIKCIPYPDQITKLDFTSDKSAVSFFWRKDNHFKIGINGSVHEVEGNSLVGSDISILLKGLLHQEYYKS